MSGSQASFWVVLAILFAGIYGSYAAYTKWQTNVRTEQKKKIEDDAPPPPGIPARFTLTDSSGKPFDTAQLKGKLWFVNFFFTTCPSICLRNNKTLQTLNEEINDKNFVLVDISCDPTVDTPETLRGYMAQHGFDTKPDRWRFLTGNIDEIRRVGVDIFQLPIDRTRHTSHCVLVDANGMTAGAFRINDEQDRDRLIRRVRKMLAELNTNETKADETESGEPKPAEPKPGDVKPADPAALKPAAPKPAEALKAESEPAAK